MSSAGIKIKFEDMQPLVAYRVTRSSSDSTVVKGNIVALDSRDGSLLIYEENNVFLGWLDSDDYKLHREMINFTCEVSEKFYIRKDRYSIRFDRIPVSEDKYPWANQLHALGKLNKANR